MVINSRIGVEKGYRRNLAKKPPGLSGKDYAYRSTAVAMLRTPDNHYTDTAIAEKVGVNRPSITSLRHKLEALGQIDIVKLGCNKSQIRRLAEEGLSRGVICERTGYTAVTVNREVGYLEIDGVIPIIRYNRNLTELHSLLKQGCSSKVIREQHGWTKEVIENAKKMRASLPEDITEKEERMLIMGRKVEQEA